MRIVAAYWRGPEPVLLVARRGALDQVPLTGPFAWHLTDDRRCTGRIRNGRHWACPDDAEVGQWAQCGRCAPFERPDCIFEPRCKDDPASCSCDFGQVEHVVYIAYHGTLAKVGMTQARREETRLREQGADAWFVAHRAASRGEARAVEQRIHFLYGIPESRRRPELLAQLARPVDHERITTRAEQLRARLAERFDPEPGLHWLEHPLTQPVERRPAIRQAGGDHSGRWIGIKGPHLLYRRRLDAATLDVAGEPVVALRFPDLAGRDLVLLDEAGGD